jgi:phage-related protein
VSSTPQEKPTRWLTETKLLTPPLSFDARLEAGGLLGALQQGRKLTMPACRPMPRIGPRCYELRVKDNESGKKEWRIIVRTDPEFVLVVEFFLKKTPKTPQAVIDLCKLRLSNYDSQQRGGTYGQH